MINYIRLLVFVLLVMPHYILADIIDMNGEPYFVSNGLVKYSYGSNVEGEYTLEPGNVLDINTEYSLSIKGEGFKETFAPVKQIPNLDKVLSYYVPTPLLNIARIHIRYGKEPVCELILLDSKLALVDDKHRDEFFNSLSRKNIKYVNKVGYITVSCKENRK